MLVTESEMLTVARLPQDKKASLPMLVTESGTVTDARLKQPAKV